MQNLFSKKYFIFEFLTVLVLLTIDILWGGRPVLEGWSHLLQFQQMGFHVFADITARYLENLPVGIGWLLGKGAVNGLVEAFTIIIFFKYLIARWAIFPLVKNEYLWVLSTLAAIMVPWNEQWYAHNLSMQFSSLCMLITLGASIRLYHCFSIKWFFIALFSVLTSFLTYEALLPCALLLPLSVILANNTSFERRSFFRLIIPVALGVFLYGLFYFWTSTHTNGITYHQQLLSGPQPIKYPFKLIDYLYHTSYFDTAWTYPFLMLFLLTLVSPYIFSHSNQKRLPIQLFILATILFFLPLLSLIYAVNFYFLSDLERVGFPVSFGFFLLSFTAASRFIFHSTDIDKDQIPSIATSTILVIALLIGTIVNAYTAYQPYRLQRFVLNQIESIINANKASSVLVRDWTGRLGDRYTFQYRDTLSDALILEGISSHLNLLFCTTEGVDRIHTAMDKIEGHTQIPRCGELSLDTTPRFVIDIRQSNNALKPTIIPYGFKYGIDAYISKGSLGGEEAQNNTNFYWVNEPTGTLTLTNQTSTDLSVTWKGQLLPAPCHTKTHIQFFVEDKTYIFSTDSKYHSFATSIKAKHTKKIHFNIIGPVCKYGNPPGDFYAGIRGMRVHPQIPVYARVAP